MKRRPDNICPAVRQSMEHPIRSKLYREQYHHAQFKAGYYRWCASRSDSQLLGGDPVTGRPRSRWNHHDTMEGKAAYKAMTRYWHCIARAMREATAR